MKNKLYLDCDDTILNSSECIIEILNKKNNTKKTIEDLSDFGYRSIDGKISKKEILKLFESDIFWDSVNLNQNFVKIKEFIDSNFDVSVVSCGTDINLRKKESFVKSNLGYDFIGVLIDEEMNLCKKHIDMENSIQIDDNIKSIENTNAAIKILLQNNEKNVWNKPNPNIDNLYVARDWDDIFEILQFFCKNPEFIKRCD